jgi:hypothetical protein
MDFTKNLLIVKRLLEQIADKGMSFNYGTELALQTPDMTIMVVGRLNFDTFLVRPFIFHSEREKVKKEVKPTKPDTGNVISMFKNKE